MFSNKDIDQIKSKGLSITQVENQLNNFKSGFSFLNINRPATIGDGILKLTDKEVEAYVKLYEDIKPNVIKFVPASGAASRMFKLLFEFYESAKNTYSELDEIEDKNVKIFFSNIKNFAFYNDLQESIKIQNKDLSILLSNGKYKEILRYFLFEEGLNYGHKPKGVLTFHRYEHDTRTAFEEHIVEGASYACNFDKEVDLHFTISKEHKEMFEALVNTKKSIYEKKHAVKLNITFSQQKSSTDVVAVDLNNKLFRNSDGSLLFRPGGHGALIENLNDLNSDIIFIKNIDNVVPDKYKTETVLYKKALAGVLISIQEQIFNYLQILENEYVSSDQLTEIKSFIKNDINVDLYQDELDSESLMKILNRPIRVCGMVKNEGEPGGGPFWVKQKDGSIDLQIVESSQIDQNNIDQVNKINSSTHFNPVDLVCSTKNYKGEKFDLLGYRNMETGFISKKSKDGKELKAQELPGLWNGAMANWNTIFVEVPIITFNPVKIVNDLLRPEHQ